MRITGAVELSRVVMELEDPVLRDVPPRRIAGREYVPADNLLTLVTNGGRVDLPADARVTVTIEVEANQ